MLSVTNVSNAEFATRSLAATTLRNILGTRTLQEILQEKESVAHHMQVPNSSDYDHSFIRIDRFNMVIL